LIAILMAIPILGGLLMLQSAVISRIPLLHGTADLVLLAVVAWALQERVETGWHWAILAGLLVGFISALPLVAALAGYLLTVGAALLLRRRVWQAPILAMFVATVFGTLLMHAISFVSLRLLGTPLPLRESLNLITIPSLLLNLVLAIPIYALLGDLANWLYPEELEV
jgi:rod shape-determining protein MreD